MKTLAFSGLLLISSFAVFAQKPEPAENAPPAVDEALRARVNQFYGAFIAGKFKEAYLLVADDSQDKFFEIDKSQYKSCEIIKINYEDKFTKATVITSCKSEWNWHGVVTPTTFPLTSTWEVIDGQWFWHYMKPTIMPTPFSPTGFIPVPPDTTEARASLALNNIPGAAKNILAKVGISKSSAQLIGNQESHDLIHVRNDMPGEVTLSLEKPSIPGLNIGLAKTKLEAHEQTEILFDWTPEYAAAVKGLRARASVRLHVEPTNQVFPINIVFESGTRSNPAPAQPQPQK